jgi:hypothetical protein
MSRLLGAVWLAGIVALAPALAQSPMSPIYPTGPAKPRPARPPVKEITSAPNREPGSAPAQAETAPAKDPAIATGVIPPAIVEPPPASTERKNPTTANARPDAGPEPPEAVKHHKRTARRTRYARRLYAPYPARWYYDTNAGTRGWGGGQFGPSPYSSTGQ